MTASSLIFEKVGDINSTYAYLCVYDAVDKKNPFMEIAVTDAKILQYTIYPGNRNVTLSVEDWSCIQEKAYEFLPVALSEFEGEN